nr:reverse transcriptase domain-containing protein [Tanacetum cinerariifolium]
MNEANMKAMQTQINIVKNELRNEMKNSIEASLSNQTNEIKNMMASLFQMNTASTLGSGSLPSNTVANPKGKLKAITTRSDTVLDGHTVPTPPPFINPEVDERVEETLIDHELFEYTIKKMLKALLSNKEKLQKLANIPLNENCLAVILKKLPKKLGDPGKFLIPCGFSELKCKALDDLGASINLMSLSVWKKVRPFLLTARALIDVHGEEMILRDGDERLTLNMRHDTSSYSNQPQKESINLINVFNNSSEDFLEDLTTSFHSPSHLLKEFADELTLITFPLEYDDDLQFDIEFDLKETEYLLHHHPTKGTDSSVKDSIDQDNLTDLNDNFVDSMPEMFTDEHALDYSSLPLFDEYDDDFLKDESGTENVYDDPFDSKGEKMKESKLLMNELDLPCDFLPSFEYDSFSSEDFSRVDALPSTNNEDKVFNPSILIQENPFITITHVDQDKKLAISHDSLIIDDFDPPLYELPFLKEVPRLGCAEMKFVTWDDLAFKFITLG